MKKIYIIALLMLSMLILNFTKVNASYNYGPLGDVIDSAEALIVNRIVDTSNITYSDNQSATISFGELVDVEGHNDKVYIVDKGNQTVRGSIIVLDDKYNFITKFGDVDGEGLLNHPQGIFVTDDYIYVADTDNKRVAVYNHNYEFVKEINTPDDPTFKQSENDTKGYDFKPLKIAVDKNNRIYVLADQIFEGILDFNPDGTFSRYIGGNSVTLSLWDAFWLLFTTKEQRKAQGYRLATTFVNFNIDPAGNLYTVSDSSEGAKVIKKLNSRGEDILKRNGYVPQLGDAHVIGGNVDVPTGQSELIDIDVNEYGNYSVLDKTRGRIFTYDFEGNLLYIGGQIGNIGGTSNNRSSLFLSPRALCYYHDQILVVDSLNNNLVVLGYTDFAKLVNQATEFYYNGNYKEAGEVWKQVLVLNTNYFLAYAGIGRAQLRDGNYKDAMVNLKLGYDDYNYSNAFKKYRYDQLTVVFPYIVGIALVGVVYLFIRSIKKSVIAEKEDEDNE